MSRPREPVFIAKAELARELGCTVGTLNTWIATGTIPPPHSRPGPRMAIWLRRHWQHYVETGRWPDDAYAVTGRS